MKRLLLAACLLPALAGCGFHLRNALLLPPDLGPVQVVSRDRHSQLAMDLAEALARAGAQVAPDGTVPDATDTAGGGSDEDAAAGGDAGGSTRAPGVAQLQLVSERWGNTPLSVDAKGRAQEYTLRYAVIFRLRRADGSDLVPQQVQELSRDYISSPALASGTEGEREILTKELRREMANSILRRIDAVSRMAQEHPQAVPATPAEPPQPGTTPPPESGTPTP